MLQLAVMFLLLAAVAAGEHSAGRAVFRMVLVLAASLGIAGLYVRRKGLFTVEDPSDVA